jgi:uncharacterized protein YggE
MVRVFRFLPWLLVVAVGALVALPRVAAAADNPPVPQLSVQSQGIVSAKPDLAIVSLGASVRRTTAEEAFNQANALMAQVNDFLRSQGIADRDISTRQFSLSPEYGRQQGDAPAPIVAWRAVNGESVKIRDFTMIGPAIEGSARILGNDAQLSGIAFTIENTDDLAAQARAQAIANAKAKAEQMAAAAGVRLVRILSISENFSPPPAPRVAVPAPNVAAAAAPVEVSAGEQNVTVTVSITWEIQ